MKFITITGSMYEVNLVEKKIRRLIGKDNPTARQGKDGDWKSYVELAPAIPTIGQSCVIVWAADTPLLPDSDPEMINIPTTMTSPVKEILGEDN